MKWKITGAWSGCDFGTFEAENPDGAMEALAKELSETDNGMTPIETCRQMLAEGRYCVEVVG